MNLFDVLFAKKLSGGGSPFPPVIKRVTGNPIELTDAASAPMVKCVTEIQGSQDLHGYDKPWVGGAGKNKLPLVLDDIKALNTTGTWNGNIYTDGNVTFSILTDNGNNVIGIVVNGATDSNYKALMLPLPSSLYGLEVIMSKYYESNDVIMGIIQDGSTKIVCTSTEVTGTVPSTGTIECYIRVPSNKTVSNATLKPMIRLSSVVDSTFSPYSNICPITAYTEGEIEVEGKNVLAPGEAKSGTLNGITYSSDGKGRYTISGLSTAYTTINFTCVQSTIPSGNDYVIGFMNSTASTGVEFEFLQDNVRSAYWGLNAVNRVTTYTVVGKTYNNFNLRIASGINVNMTFSPMFVRGNVSDFPTTFYEYALTTHTTTYPSAIYRGSEDVVNGEVVTEWGMIASYAGETLPGEWISDRDEYDPNTPPTAGAQVAYELATPTTSPVTPTNLPIRTLSGYNHIESSTGDMEIDYITDAYQDFVDTTERAVPSTRKSGLKAFDIFKTLDEPKKPEAPAEESKPEEKETEEGAKK